MPSFILRNVDGVESVWYRFNGSHMPYPTISRIINTQDMEMDKEYDISRMILFMIIPDGNHETEDSIYHTRWWMFK